MSPRPFPLALLLLLLPAQALAVQVGVAPATTKVLPADPLPDASAVELGALLGEWEAFQLVILDPAGATGVDVELSDLVGPGGATIPADAARLYREHFVDVPEGSPMEVSLHEREPGLYPDPLIPFDDPWEGGPVGAPFELAPGEVGAVFVDLHAPRDATPGEYAGTATVTADDGGSVEVPIALTVWPVALPLERTIGTSFGFSFNIPGKFHGGAEGDDAQGYDVILDRYYEALHRHRLDPTRVNGPVTFEYDGDGQLLPVDWTDYDAAVGPWMDGSKFDDGLPVTRFSVDRFRPGHGDDFTDQELQAAAAFAEHLDAQGWWDKAWVYSIDEPWLNGGDASYEQIHSDVRALVEASPLWEGKALVTASYDERIDGDIGIWCPVTPMFGDWFYTPGVHQGADFYAERTATTDEELWLYVCNANFPPAAGYDIDTAIGYEPRMVKWGAWYEGASGFLYWRTNYWVDDDPWNVFRNVEQFTHFGARNGDGFLLYPGDHDGTSAPLGSPEWLAIDGPIESYRLKQIRDGLEDWELFELAQELGGGDYARAQVARAHTRFGDFFAEDCSGDVPRSYCPDDQPWTLDQDVLLEARRNVVAKVLFLTDPDAWPDPEALAEPPVEEPADCACAAAPAPASGLLLLLPGLVAASRRRR